ncbi:MAG: extracellular solute-binding protein [Chloroflexi bacterium]|nr:extracellular solute-binding protein [Chloroflexota bacterium]
MKLARYLSIVLLVLLVAAVAACAAPAAPAPAEQPPAAEEATVAPAEQPAAAPETEAPPPLDVVKWDYPPKFDNVTINLVGDAGHNLRPYEFWKDEFEKAGITINIIEVPFSGVYEKEKTEFVAGTGAFDVVTFYPAYIGDFAGNGYLEPLDEYMAKSPASVWDPNPDDVLKPFWELYSKFGGKVYALPVDGDVHMLMYRKDLFENPEEKAAFKEKYGKELAPPETWEDWLQIGEFFTRDAGETLAGETLERPFYGSADFAQRGFSFAWFVDRWAAFGEPYFDENMVPQVNSPNAVKALQNFVDGLKNAPPDMLGYGYDELRDAFLKGNVAMVVQWTDVPKKGADPNQSAIAGKIGVGRVPGWNINGTVVHRAMMPVGRVVAVAADSKNKEAAYWVAKHVSYDRSLEDVSTSLTGLDPYRHLHFNHPEAYTMFPTIEEAQAYLDGVSAAMADGYPEIFIPGAAQYEDALDLHVNKALAGQETPQEALDATAAEWEKITDRLGRDKQIELWDKALAAYRSLGLIQ